MHNLGLSPHSSCLHADVQQDPESYKTVGSGEIIIKSPPYRKVVSVYGAVLREILGAA